MRAGAYLRSDAGSQTMCYRSAIPHARRRRASFTTADSSCRQTGLGAEGEACLDEGATFLTSVKDQKHGTCTCASVLECRAEAEMGPV